MPLQHLSVIPIRQKTPVSEADELVADVAYKLWHSSPFRCGPPEAALLTALRMVKGKPSDGPLLVPKVKQKLHRIIVMKRSS
jgi:hypothetical protein